MDLTSMTAEQLHAAQAECDQVRQGAKEKGRAIKEELARRDIVRNVKAKLANNWPLKTAEAAYVASLTPEDQQEMIGVASASLAEKVQRAVAQAAGVGVKAKI